MQSDRALADYVVEHLGFLGSMSSRPIFGGVGVFHDERLLGVVIRGELYLATGPLNLDDFLSRGMPQFKPYPNAFDLTTDHHRVPEEIFKDPAQLKSWAERSLNAAIHAAKLKQMAGIERVRAERRAKKKAAKKGGS